METYLVTGGAGFIGSHFIRCLLSGKTDVRVLNLDKLTYAGNLENVAFAEGDARYTFVQGDVCDQALVSSLFRTYDIHACVHFAAESHVDRSIAAPAVFVRTNVEGTQCLLSCARAAWEQPDGSYPPGVRFVQMSTDEVYGSIESGSFTEESPLAPRSPYSASKAAADLFVRAYQTTYGFPARIVRCANNFGPNQHPEKLIPHVIQCALSLQPVPVYGDGGNVRDWIAVGDCVRAIQLVAERGTNGAIYHIGADHACDNLTLVRQILDELHRRADERITQDLITFTADRKGHDRRYSLDCTKLTAQLGFAPSLDFTQYLCYTIDWYVNKFTKNHE